MHWAFGRRRAVGAAAQQHLARRHLDDELPRVLRRAARDCAAAQLGRPRRLDAVAPHVAAAARRRRLTGARDRESYARRLPGPGPPSFVGLCCTVRRRVYTCAWGLGWDGARTRVLHELREQDVVSQRPETRACIRLSGFDCRIGAWGGV
eukprot:6549970-Prymnesium_polylepis.1